MTSDFAQDVAKYPKSSYFASVWAYCFAPLAIQVVNVTLTPILIINHPFISFFHLLRFIASSVFNLHAWQSFCRTSLRVLSCNFSTPIKTTKYCSWVVQICPKQIQDGGRTPSWKKSKNCNISATGWPILMKFDMVMYIHRAKRCDAAKIECVLVSWMS